MPGINDLPECQPEQKVMDITVLSPNLDKRELYAYWHSPFSPYSILTATKDLYPTWTTGKVFLKYCKKLSNVHHISKFLTKIQSINPISKFAFTQ